MFHCFLRRSSNNGLQNRALQSTSSFLITLSNYKYIFILVNFYSAHTSALKDNEMTILATFHQHTKSGRERDQLFPLRVTDDSVESRNIISAILQQIHVHHISAKERRHLGRK